MNHLESLLNEYLTIQGYIVVCNTKVGKLDHGGWKMELDVVAYCPTRDHLVHYEPSLDANSWIVREQRFTKKFSAAREHILDIPQFAFLNKADVENMEQIAIFPSVPVSQCPRVPESQSPRVPVSQCPRVPARLFGWHCHWCG